MNALESGAYRERLDHPTLFAAKMMRTYSDTQRSLYAVNARSGDAMRGCTAQFAATATDAGQYTCSSYRLTVTLSREPGNA